MQDTVIIGAGPAGLSTAYHLNGPSWLILEQHERVGGLCRSIEDQGFTFDYAGHIMFTNSDYVKDVMYPKLLGDNVHWQDREAWVYSKGVYTRYPFQASTYGLPEEVVKDCIMGAVKARYEGDHGKEPQNFKEYIEMFWGEGIAKHFMMPYNQKLWAVPLDEMSHTWLSGRVPQPNLEEIIMGGLRPLPKPLGPNARFGYPIKGGFEALVRGFLPYLDERRIRLNTQITAIHPAQHKVTLADGSSISYKRLVVTMPLPVLVNKLLTSAPAAVKAAAARLRHVSVRCVNLGINRGDVTDKHWIYYPEDTVFHRIFVQSNASKECAPPGTTGLTCEITYSAYKPLPADGLIERCIEDCKRVGMIREGDEVLVANEADLPYAYVVPDTWKEQSVKTIRDWLESVDIVLSGRFAEWEYYNSDHAILAGKRAAETVNTMFATERFRAAANKSIAAAS
ncbi:MAG: FAD-dependent oxidoreductase [Anaerolineae bacterium]